MKYDRITSVLRIILIILALAGFLVVPIIFLVISKKYNDRLWSRDLKNIGLLSLIPHVLMILIEIPIWIMWYINNVDPDFLWFVRKYF